MAVSAEQHLASVPDYQPTYALAFQLQQVHMVSVSVWKFGYTNLIFVEDGTNGKLYFATWQQDRRHTRKKTE